MRILVTSALPYANGPLHLGQIAGCYLPSDIYVRYKRAKKANVVHICGTDEHGVPITIKAEKEHITPLELVDHYYEVIKNSFSALNISFDFFGRTSREHHKKLSQNFFLKIYKKGYIEKREDKNYYCEKCKRFLPDRYIEGICPHCKSDGARGDQCENCGRWLESFELLSPKCKICGGIPQLKETFHYYFLLPKLKKKLENWLAEKDKWKDFVRNFALSWVREGLKPRSITRDLNWGVPVPIPSAEGKVLYVWFDAPIGYISITEEWAKENNEKWESWWKDKDTKLIHFLGKDNIIFHSVIWPAMLFAHGEYILPSEIPANQYLVIDGGKMSTSRGKALWVDEFLRKYPSDYIRFSLSLNLPETKDASFSIEDFTENVNTHLANNIGNLIQRILSFTSKHFHSRVPSKKIPGELENRIIEQIKISNKKIQNFIESFRFREALKEILFLSAEGNRYFDYSKPWESVKKDKEKAGTTMHYCLGLLNALRVLLWAFIPSSMEKLGKYLNSEKIDFSILENPLIEEGTPLASSPDILFKKIEKEELALQKRSPDEEIKIKEKISFNEFLKMDLRIGKIISAEKIPNADKLIKLKISFGGFERIMVAGIGDRYSPSYLLNKKILVLLNLEPKKIRGTESQGMILACDTKEGPILLIPEKEVEEGTVIK